MKTKTLFITGISMVGLTAAALQAARMLKLRVHLDLDKKTKRDPDAVISTISQIEREPEMIPFIKSVDILEAGPGFARYRVYGKTLGVSWWMQYLKVWSHEAGTVRWWSEAGSYALKNDGLITVQREPDGNVIHLMTGYSVGMPVIGHIAEQFIQPFVKNTFSKWLNRLAK